MKKQIYILFLLLCSALGISAQKTTVKWELSDPTKLSNATIAGDDQNLLTASYLNGTGIARTEIMTSSNAATGYTAVTYDPAFTQYLVKTKQTSKTATYNIAFGIKPQSGHTFKPTKITFDAAKCGTDGGNFDVYLKTTSTTEKAWATAQIPLRNRVDNDNPDGCSHHEYAVKDYIVDGEYFLLFLYIYNINGVDDANPKAIAFRNVVVEGVLDEPVFTADHYLTEATFDNKDGETVSVLSLLEGLKDDGQITYPTLLQGDPTNFQLTLIEGFTYEVNYENKVATFRIKDSNGEVVFTFRILFKFEKAKAKPLNRGLIAVNLSSSGGSGNLVSWRYRESDQNKVKFKLFRGSTATTQNTKVNNGKYIYNRTNFLDASAGTSSYYRLEVYDLEDNLIETEVSRKTWSNQSFEIPTSTPTDTRGLGATYTPNDASFCDMDGDGEYEIVLKWEPSNAKDAASGGVTSSNYIDCYKLNGTQLWRIDIGPNLRSGAHTSPFLCWDFDGDGYGELICKTAPGTIDGEGNYVIMGNDDPTKSWLNGRGKPDAGPEYVTVFDGLTGANLSTISYHTKYGDVSTSFWGDNEQNRSERYLACVAYLDGKTPSAVMCRGYYSGAALGAYDWDGSQLKLRWLHRSSTSGKELWGEGAHFVISGDVDNDGCDEIVYGSACLDHDGKTMVYRTGLGHGDALHLGDFDWNNDGLEVFMPHEKKPFGFDLRDARTGKLLVHQTADGDTGRGLAANFDSSHDGAELMASCTGALMDCKGNAIADSWAIGNSGAGINNRIYWDGDPYDEFFDKSIIAHWNANGKYFDRIQVNGSNYTPGNLCNYTKFNPCVLGDILGDWREEIVTYNGETNALIITTTNSESNYRIPHLMDNRQYAELIANQNCAYNQPPHLSYDPARTHTKVVTLPESGWMPVYTEYALQAPTNAKAYYVTNFDTAADTLKMTAIETTIPPCGFLLKGKPGTEVRMKPASVKAAAYSANKLLGDGYLPTTLESTNTVSYYQWGYREGIGLGFFRIDYATIPADETYLKISSSARDAEYYLIGEKAVGITPLNPEANNNEHSRFDLSGRHSRRNAKGVLIEDGKKTLIK